MGRPKSPLIDRDEAIATALSIIDKDRLELQAVLEGWRALIARAG